LSLQGAAASIETARTLRSLIRMDIRPVAILPVMVDRRLQMTEIVTASLQELSARTGIPLLSPIRTDTTVTKCSRAKSFLIDFDPRAKAIEDYHVALDQLLTLLEQRRGTSAQTEKEGSAISA
jgi:cellulose biosynthesis protein BcsQ